MMGDAVKALGANLPEVYVASSYAAVSEVLRDGKRFSSSGYKATIGLVMGPTILVMDEPEHGRYRSLIQMAFRTKALKKWEHELVAPDRERLHRPRSSPAAGPTWCASSRSRFRCT